MTVNYTTNLALGQPVTGTESGTWGDDVNNAVTSYLDIAIAGGLAVTVTTADVTLTLTQGTSVATNIGSTTAQYAILNVSGAMTAARNLILPSSSRQYVINNACTGGFLLTVKGSATTGVTLVNGEKAHVFWTGTDYSKLSNTPGGAGTFSSITNTGLTATRVVFSTTNGLETDSANLTFNGTILTSTGFAGPINGTVGATTPATGAFTSLTASTTLGVTGVSTLTAGAIVQGLTVGLGAGAVSTNTAVGASALASNSTGSDVTAVGNEAYRYGTAVNNTAFGSKALGSAVVTGTENTSIGRASLYVNTSGANNVAVGSLSLFSNTTASNNTAVGYQSLYTNTTGAENTATGYQALKTNSTGSATTAFGAFALTVATVNDNSAFGFAVLTSNTSGIANAGFGGRYTGNTLATLASNTTGSFNTAFGNSALSSNTTASNNTAVGYQAGYTNSTGEYLTAIGGLALKLNTTGVRNVAVGYQSLSNNTTASYNTAIGMQALSANTTGANNTALGNEALVSNTTASSNTAVGYQSMYSNTTGDGQAFGAFALYSQTTGSNNTAIGATVLYANTTGANNTGTGLAALRFNTTGANNTALGSSALYSNTTASNNTAVGYQSLYSNIAGANQTAVGFKAAFSISGSTYGGVVAIGNEALYSVVNPYFTVAIGYQAGYSYTSTGATENTGSTFIGNAAGRFTTTANNVTFLGGFSGYNNTTGSNNTALGGYALYANTTASNNTAVGYQAGYAVTTAGNNTFIGKGAGLSLTTGTDNTFISRASGEDITTGSKNTIIGRYSGNQGSLDIRTASNYIVLSDGDGNPRGIFDNSGNFGVGTTPSSRVDARLAASGSGAVVTVGNVNNGQFGGFGITDGAPYPLEVWGNVIVFKTNGASYAATAEKMRLDTSGYLGIGETVPVSRIHVSGAGFGATTTIRIDSTSTSNSAPPSLILTRSSSAVMSGQGIGNIYFTRLLTDASLNTAASIVATGNNSSSAPTCTINYDAITNHVWKINSTEVARIDTSGNLLVNSTAISNSPAKGVQLWSGSSNSIGGVAIGHDTGVASGNYYATFNYASGLIGSITQSGTTAVLFNVTSDQRLKENIQDAESASALIDALQVRQFDWKTDNTHQRYGFIAQELVTVAPEAVHQPVNEEEMMAVDYSKLVPMLVKEIQSLRKRLAAAGIA